MIQRTLQIVKSAAFGAFAGLIGGLVIAMALFTIHHRPLITLGFALVFLLFHLSDLRRFARTANWLGLIGRIVAVYAITAFIVSFFVLALGGAESAGRIDGILTAGSVGISIGLSIFWSLLSDLAPGSGLRREIIGIAQGAELFGILP